jgi:Tol biopolymer transport system component
MRHHARLALVALSIVIAACERAGSPTSPELQNGFPPDAAASKQSTTNSLLLFDIYDNNLNVTNVGRANDDGSNRVTLTSGLTFQTLAAWAPDGKRIVFESVAFDPIHASLFSMNADGTGVTRLTFVRGDGSDDEPVGFSKGIVFARTENVSASRTSSIALLDTDGGITRLTSGPQDFDPAPSPKGKSIAFLRADDIFVLDLATGGLTNVTRTPGCQEFFPAYSPSGKRIAYSMLDCGPVAGGIFVMDGDGTNVTRLTTQTGARDDRPKWSPDGKRIAFTRYDAAGGSIRVMDADGSNVVEILSPHASAWYFLTAWARY